MRAFAAFLATLLLTLPAFAFAACGDDASPAPPDAGSPDAGALDAGGSDAGGLDAGAPDAGGLEACRPFATDPDGKRYADLATAAACAGCDAACILRADTSVTLLRCGRRTGDIEFTADGFESVIQTPDGIFRDVDAWNEAVPCP